MIAHLLCIPPIRQENVAAALEDIPRKAFTTSLRKWCKLLGLLHSITLAVAGLRGMFTLVQHALKIEAGRQVQITTDVHDELEAWHELFHSLAIRATHLCELEPFAPIWNGTTDASGSGMVGICQDPEGQYFVWYSPFTLQPRDA